MDRRNLRKHAPTILSVFGIIGMVSTVVLSVKVTPKAVEIIKEAEKEKGEKLTKLEVVNEVGVLYFPPLAIGVGTIACIFGSNFLNKKHQASLSSAYMLVDKSFKEYKKKLIELYGKDTHDNVVNALIVEKAQDTCVYSEYIATICDLASDNPDKRKVLFYEEIGDRFFESTIEQVMNAEYHINRNYILRGWCCLNELYEFLGLEPTDYGSVVGWEPTDEGEFWIEFNHRKMELEDGRECYVIEMPFAPREDEGNTYYNF